MNDDNISSGCVCIAQQSENGGMKLSRFKDSGFTLSETMIGMAVAMVGLLGLFASSTQAVRIIHTGKQTASASQMLQQRLESFRHARPWSNATTFDGVARVVTDATISAVTFPNAIETFKFEPYPEGGVAMVITRTPQGNLTCTGPDLSSYGCVKLTATVTWTGYGRLERTRQLSTILAKGGL
jgi:hypothetical protein